MADRIHSDEQDRMRTAGTTSRLARLDDLDDFEIADGEPDIRGWDVKTSDGVTVGKVDGLIADPDAREVRYIEMKANRDVLGTQDGEQVLIPIGVARLDEAHDDVLLDHMPAAGLRGAPRFGRTVPTAEHERSLREYFGRDAGRDADRERDAQRRFFGTRRQGREERSYLMVSEERLAVGRRDAAMVEREVLVERTADPARDPRR